LCSSPWVYNYILPLEKLKVLHWNYQQKLYCSGQKHLNFYHIYHFRNEPYEHLYIDIQKNIPLCASVSTYHLPSIWLHLFQPNINSWQKQHAKNEKEQKYKNWDLILANAILYLFKCFVKYLHDSDPLGLKHIATKIMKIQL